MQESLMAAVYLSILNYSMFLNNVAQKCDIFFSFSGEVKQFNSLVTTNPCSTAVAIFASL